MGKKKCRDGIGYFTIKGSSLNGINGDKELKVRSATLERIPLDTVQFEPKLDNRNIAMDKEEINDTIQQLAIKDDEIKTTGLITGKGVTENPLRIINGNEGGAPLFSYGRWDIHPLPIVTVGYHAMFGTIQAAVDLGFTHIRIINNIIEENLNIKESTIIEINPAVNCTINNVIVIEKSLKIEGADHTSTLTYNTGQSLVTKGSLNIENLSIIGKKGKFVSDSSYFSFVNGKYIGPSLVDDCKQVYLSNLTIKGNNKDYRMISGDGLFKIRNITLTGECNSHVITLSNTRNNINGITFFPAADQNRTYIITLTGTIKSIDIPSMTVTTIVDEFGAHVNKLRLGGDLNLRCYNATIFDVQCQKLSLSSAFTNNKIRKIKAEVIDLSEETTENKWNEVIAGKFVNDIIMVSNSNLKNFTSVNEDLLTARIIGSTVDYFIHQGNLTFNHCFTCDFSGISSESGSVSIVRCVDCTFRVVKAKTGIFIGGDEDGSSQNCAISEVNCEKDIFISGCLNVALSTINANEINLINTNQNINLTNFICDSVNITKGTLCFLINGFINSLMEISLLTNSTLSHLIINGPCTTSTETVGCLFENIYCSYLSCIGSDCTINNIFCFALSSASETLLEGENNIYTSIALEQGGSPFRLSLGGINNQFGYIAYNGTIKLVGKGNQYNNISFGSTSSGKHDILIQGIHHNINNIKQNETKELPQLSFVFEAAESHLSNCLINSSSDSTLMFSGANNQITSFTSLQPHLNMILSSSANNYIISSSRIKGDIISANTDENKPLIAGCILKGSSYVCVEIQSK